MEKKHLLWKTALSSILQQHAKSQHTSYATALHCVMAMTVWETAGLRSVTDQAHDPTSPQASLVLTQGLFLHP